MHFVNKQQASASESKTAFFVFHLLTHASHLLYLRIIIFSGFSYSSLLPVHQEVMILFSETVLIRKCFMRYYNFVHKLNSQLRMETRLA